MNFKNLLKSKFLLICLGLIFFLRLPSLFEPYWYGDEGIYLTLGQGINHGLTLYQDIHDNKPPTLYYLAAVAKTVFGFRLLLLLWMLPAYYFFYRLALNFVVPKLSRIATIIFIIFTSIPLIEGNIANAEIFMILPTVWGFYELFVNKKIILPGLLLGLAFTIKVPVAVEFAFLAIWLFLFVSRFNFIKIISFGLAFSLPTAVLLVYYSIKGAFSQFLFAALLQNFGYLSSWTTGSHSGSATSSGLVTRGLILIFCWVVLFGLNRFRLIKDNLFFLLCWLGATVFGALLSTRPYPHYLIQVLPPLVILVMVIFSSGYHRLAKAVTVLSLVLTFFFISKFKFYVYPVFSYYNNFYLQGNQLTFFGSNLPEIYSVADYLKRHTLPSQKIFVWGDEPYIYPLADRLPVGRYTVAYHIVDFRQYEYTIDRLKIELPPYIVYYPQPGRPFPDLDNFISNYYAPDTTFGRAIIYRLRQ